MQREDWRNITNLIFRFNTIDQPDLSSIRILQGPLAMIRELERDHEKVLDNIQCIEYELDFEDDKTLNSAKLKINNALCNIENPLKVNHI